MNKRVLICPNCGEKLISDELKHRCNSCGFFVPRIIRRKVIPLDIYTELFKNRKTDFMPRFYKKGSDETFSAMLILQDDWKITLAIDEKTDMNCPICESSIYRFFAGYRCNKKGCNVNIWRKYREKTISETQLLKLLKDKKTDLIKGFVSQKTLRRYNGFLVLDEKGRTKFEFEEKKAPE